jgi:DNA ligase (NAD+)
LSAIHEIGPAIAASVHQFLASEHGMETIRGLQAAGVRMTSDLFVGEEAGENAATRPLEGKTLVVTGTLVKYTRDEIKDLIEKAGGRAASSVSKSTDFLVAGEKAGSKLDKATQLGVPILSEVEFEAMLASADGGTADS